MSITSNQTLIDEKRSALQQGLHTYVTARQAYKDTLPTQVVHEEDMENPHKDDKHSIGLGNLNNWPMTSTVDGVDETEDNTYSTPESVGIQVQYALDGIEGYGVELVPANGVNVYGNTVSSMISNLTLNINANPGRASQFRVLMRQPPSLANGFNISATNVIWLDSPLFGEWTETLNKTEQFETEAEATQFKDDVNAGLLDDRDNTYYVATGPVENGGMWDVNYTHDVRHLTFNMQAGHNYHLKVEACVNAQGVETAILKTVEDLGKANPAHATSYCIDSSQTADQANTLTGDRNRGYIGFVSPSLSAGRDFTQEVLSLLPSVGDDHSDPTSVEWVRMVRHGVTYYAPTECLKTNLSYRELFDNNLLEGEKLITVDVDGAGNYMTFAVLTPSKEEFDVMHHAMLNGYSGAPLYFFNPTDYGYNLSTGKRQWSRTMATNGQVYTSNGMSTLGQNIDTKSSEEGWRPFLVPIYTTTFA